MTGRPTTRQSCRLTSSSGAVLIAIRRLARMTSHHPRTLGSCLKTTVYRLDHHPTENAMTEKRTNASYDSGDTTRAADHHTRREPPAAHDSAAPIATMDAVSAVPKPYDPLLSGWKELAWLYCKDAEFILEDLEQISGCELWLARLIEVREQFRESVYTRLRVHIEGLLYSHREKQTQPAVAPSAAGIADDVQHSSDSRSNSVDTSNVAALQSEAMTPAGDTPAVVESTQPPGESDSTPAPPAVFTLSDWWDGHGSVPDVFVRSALFAAVRTSTRRLQNATVASLSNIEIVVTGPQLTQPDLDVWMTAASLARHDGMARVNRRAFLEHLDRATGSSDRDWLIKSLKRQRECYIEVSLNEQPRFKGHLLKSLKLQKRLQKNCEPNTHEIELEFEPSIVTLFQDGSTNIKISARSDLRSDPLANWLLGFYSSHGEPYAIKVETIQKLCGVSGSISSFRRRLIDALLTLEERRHLGSARIANGKVLVNRTVGPTHVEQESKDEKEPQTPRRKAGHSWKPPYKRNLPNRRWARTVRRRLARMWRRLRMALQAVSWRCWLGRRSIEAGNLRGSGVQHQIDCDSSLGG